MTGLFGASYRLVRTFITPSVAKLPLLLKIALPFAVYLIPIACGYEWSTITPGTPNLPAMGGYVGRQPKVATTVEVFGTGVIAGPYVARLRNYLVTRQMPLWNPYQGLGQPYAAQGDGSPYF